MTAPGLRQSAPSSPRTVLIIDDSRDLGDLYAAALRMSGVGVQVAHNANAGWTAVRALRPDLILLDIDLGASSGLDLLDRLRGQAGTEPAPLVVILTSSDDPAHRTHALAAGVDGYLIKTDLRLPQFLETVAGYLDPAR